MFRRAIVAILGPVALTACAPWHMFSSGSPCKPAITYGRHVTAGATTVPISGGRAGEAIQIGHVDVTADLARRASDVVEQFDDLQLSTCRTMHSLKREDRPPYLQANIQIVTDFSFVISSLDRAQTQAEYAAAVVDGQARLGSDTRATGQLGR